MTSTRMLPCLLALVLSQAGLLAASNESKSTPTAGALTLSIVRVEYELQYDKADAPEGGLGNEPCPGCGQFHGSNLRQYLEEERPVEAAGYVVSPDRVLTADPLIHPRFIKRITVRSATSHTTATVAAHAVNQNAVFLGLDQPLADTTPLQFNPKAGAAAHLLSAGREGGQWVMTRTDFPRLRSATLDGAQHHLMTTRGIALAASGEPVGAVFNSYLPADGSWLGSPLEWPQLNAKDMSAALTQLEAVADRSLVRVVLGFRSPPSDANENSQSYRYSMMDDDEEEGGTVRNVLGVLLPENRALVLAHLAPRLTARLETLTVYGPDNTGVPAEFTASLKHFGALVATLKQPVATPALPLRDADLLALRERLLLRADVRLQGETRASYVQPSRFTTCNMGPRQQVYPELSETAEDVFLFTRAGELLALPVSHRAQVSGERDRYSINEAGAVPARLLAEAVADLAGNADPNNVPRSAEEENRLAWLGVELQPMNRDLARANNVAGETRDGETGALVTAVNEGSPAAAAGIQVGSVLLRLTVPGQPLPVEVHLEEDMMRGQPFPWERLDEVPDQYFERIPQPWPSTRNTFTRALTDLGFGTRYVAEFFANGQTLAKEFEVVPGPSDYESAPRFKCDPLGLTVRDLTYDVRRYLQRGPDEPGVVVSKIETGSKASIAGVKPYELITHINDKPVGNVKDFETLVAAKGELKLSIKRMNRGRIATIKAGE